MALELAQYVAPVARIPVIFQPLGSGHFWKCHGRVNFSLNNFSPHNLARTAATALQLAQFIAPIEMTVTIFETLRSGDFSQSYGEVNVLSTISTDCRCPHDLAKTDAMALQLAQFIVPIEMTVAIF